MRTFLCSMFCVVNVVLSERVYVLVCCYQRYDLCDYVLRCCCCCSLHIIYTLGSIFIVARNGWHLLKYSWQWSFCAFQKMKKLLQFLLLLELMVLLLLLLVVVFSFQPHKFLIDKALHEIRIIIYSYERRIEIAALDKKERQKRSTNGFQHLCKLQTTCVFGHRCPDPIVSLFACQLFNVLVTIRTLTFILPVRF